MKKNQSRDTGSFRDPSGFVYYQNNEVYRKINKSYFREYNHLMTSGLYEELVSLEMLINHKEVSKTSDFIIISPTKVPFISYPYEWCFLQLKEAAILTLNIQKIALKYGMTLKDASAYNIQILNGKAIFIDTLSFGLYEEDTPWGAYGQFCRHFMAPLLLMTYVNENLNSLSRNYIDGIPLNICNDILKGRGGLTSFEHIKLHSKSIDTNNEKRKVGTPKLPKQNLINMLDMMIRQIEKLDRKRTYTEWDNYYDNTNYNEIADNSKQSIVEKFLNKINITNKDIIYDIGANDGKYSRIASEKAGQVIAFDIDSNTVNRNYHNVQNSDVKNILPLIMDFNNPSPAIGFGCVERKNITERNHSKCIMALAVIHHICISNNVSFEMVVNWLSKMTDYLIIEFVPKSDSQVEKLLSTRIDIFPNYDEENFEEAFSTKFNIISKEKVTDSKRTIYLMEVDNNE